MVQLVAMFGWQYVSIVYEESSYGQMVSQLVDFFYYMCYYCQNDIEMIHILASRASIELHVLNLQQM